LLLSTEEGGPFFSMSVMSTTSESAEDAMSECDLTVMKDGTDRNLLVCRMQVNNRGSERQNIDPMILEIQVENRGSANPTYTQQHSRSVKRWF
jgi:hypothetical protein